MKADNEIRAIAICLFSHNGRILAAEGYDPVKQETFYRPLGGTIEFGEHSADTVVRELDEELGVAVADLRYVATLENVFTYDGRTGHEIVLIYDGRFVDETLYDRDDLTGYEADASETFRAVWLEVAAMRQPGAAPLYPSGLLDLLD